MTTKTINQLHFEDLDPIRFEELILSMIFRMKKWVKLDHFGKMGSDGGIDIRAIEKLEDGTDNIYCFQCKRYLKITNKELQNIIDEFILKNDFIPQVYILVVSCSLTRKQIEYFERYSQEHGFDSVSVWTKSVIESMLYADYQDLLFIYFGINLLSEKERFSQEKFDILKKYLQELKNNLKSYEYKGELSQTFGCLLEIYKQEVEKFKFIHNEHDNNDYLFDYKTNKIILKYFEDIYCMIDEYTKMCLEIKYDGKHEKMVKVTEQMDKVCLEIDNFEKEYIELIKRQIAMLF